MKTQTAQADQGLLVLYLFAEVSITSEPLEQEELSTKTVL